MNPTIYDIANKSGVSKSTVSRVLNGSKNVSKDKEKKVLQAIKELGYTPNKMAQGLGKGSTNTILVTSRRTQNTTLGNPYFSDVLQAIAIESQNHNFDIIFQTAHSADEELNKCIYKIKEKMIKGIIILSSSMDESFLSELNKYEIPIVVIGKVDHSLKNIYTVDTNNFNDSYSMVLELIKRNHKKIGCIHSSKNVHVSIERIKGYRQALFDNDLDIRSDWIVDGGFLLDEGVEAAKILLTQNDRPTAIFATDALKLFSIYQVASDLNIQIPEELSLIGFNDNTLSPFFKPRISGVCIPTEQLGMRATQILLDAINDAENIENNTLIPTKLELTSSLKSI